MGQETADSGMAVSKPLSPKIPLIDVTRGIAILYVMAAHSRAALAFPEAPWAQYFWSLFSQNGIYGVSVFFVVSGFLITRLIDQGPGGLLRPDVRWFYARRAGRIVPLWTLSILFGAVMIYGVTSSSNRYLYCFKGPGALFDVKFWLSLPMLCFNWLALLRTKVSYYPLHWALMWSLAVEEQFYLVYPWALRRLNSVRNLALVLAVVALLGPMWRLGCYFAGSENVFLSLFSSFSGFDLIALGALVYLGLKYGKAFLQYGAGWNYLTAGVGIGLTCWAFLGTKTNELGSDLIFGTTLMGLGTALFLFGLLNQGITDCKILRPLAWPGRYSYFLYLSHAAALYFLHPYIRPLPTWEAFLIYIVTTTLVAAFSYKYFEMPCNHWVRGWFGEK